MFDPISARYRQHPALHEGLAVAFVIADLDAWVEMLAAVQKNVPRRTRPVSKGPRKARPRRYRITIEEF